MRFRVQAGVTGPKGSERPRSEPELHHGEQEATMTSSPARATRGGERARGGPFGDTWNLWGVLISACLFSRGKLKLRG